MTEDKRTKAELLEALDAAQVSAQTAVGDCETHYREQMAILKARLDRQSPEARAVDMCVQALDALKKAEDDRRSSTRSGYSSLPMYSTSYGGGGYEEIQPLDAVAQVLTYLRVRFGHLDSQGEIQHLKQRVNTLLNENGRLREQLAQIAQSAGQK